MRKFLLMQKQNDDEVVLKHMGQEVHTAEGLSRLIIQEVLKTYTRFACYSPLAWLALLRDGRELCLSLISHY